MRGTPALYFKSLNRPFLVLGVERSLLYLFLCLSLCIAFSSRFNLIAVALSILLFGILHAAGVLIARADKQMLAIYRRHIHKKTYYAPIPGIHAKVALLQPSVPLYQGKRGLV